MITEDLSARELWWIYSPVNGASWAGLRVATFIKATGSHAELFVIHNEIGDRIGIRIWEDVKDREHWIKIKKIDPPSQGDIFTALAEREMKD